MASRAAQGPGERQPRSSGREIEHDSLDRRDDNPDIEHGGPDPERREDNREIEHDRGRPGE